MNLDDTFATAEAEVKTLIMQRIKAPLQALADLGAVNPEIAKDLLKIARKITGEHIPEHLRGEMGGWVMILNGMFVHHRMQSITFKDIVEIDKIGMAVIPNDQKLDEEALNEFIETTDPKITEIGHAVFHSALAMVHNFSGALIAAVALEMAAALIDKWPEAFGSMVNALREHLKQSDSESGEWWADHFSKEGIVILPDVREALQHSDRLRKQMFDQLRKSIRKEGS